MSKSELIKSAWSNRIYVCSKGCGYISELDCLWSWDRPCPDCGAEKQRKTGRFIYRLEPLWWFPLIKRKVFVDVEWYKEDA